MATSIHGSGRKSVSSTPLVGNDRYCDCRNLKIEKLINKVK